MAYNNHFRRSVFGGFRRKDVLDCFDTFLAEKADEIKELNNRIEELQRQLTEKEGHAQAQIAEITVQKNEAIAERDQVKEQLATCEQALSDRTNRLEELIAAQSRVASETKAAQHLLKEKDVKIAFLEDKNQKLILKMEAFERKSRKYDALSAEIGEMMLEAKQSAESIIRQAEERSMKLTTSTGNEIDRLSADLEQFLHQLSHIENSINSTQANISAFRKTAVAPNRTTAPQAVAPTREPTPVVPRIAEKTDRKAVPEPENSGRVGKTINRLIELIGRD